MMLALSVGCAAELHFVCEPLARDPAGNASCSIFLKLEKMSQRIAACPSDLQTQHPLDLAQVIRVDAENKCLLVKGAIPGKPGNLVKVTPAKIVGKNIPPWAT
jgi:hypothetical protein